MTFILWLIKAYIAVLLFRWILTQQELTFNSLGKMVAKLTNPVLAMKGKLKSDTDKFIPLLIILLGLFYGALLGLVSNMPFSYAIISTYQNLLGFLAMFFMVCVLLGSLANPNSGTFPLYFYRLGNIWVKPTRKMIPVKGNSVVIPAILFIMGVFIVINCMLVVLKCLFLGIPVSPLHIAGASLVTFGIHLTTLLRFLVIAIIARALLSWVSPDPRNTLVQLVYYITEPVLLPFKKIIPPMGMLDLSALVAIVVIGILQSTLMSILVRFGMANFFLYM